MQLRCGRTYTWQFAVANRIVCRPSRTKLSLPPSSRLWDGIFLRGSARTLLEGSHSCAMLIQDCISKQVSDFMGKCKIFSGDNGRGKMLVIKVFARG